LTEASLPLTGVRVLDLTRHLAGPVGGQVLADLGAEVIKVEGPRNFDPSRNNAPVPRVDGPRYNLSTYFNEINRSKLSLCLDLKHSAGREIFKRLAVISDVLVENNSAGVMDRLGLGYDVLSHINPRLVMLSANAFGSTGPYVSYSSFGPGIDSMSGIAALTGYEGGPPLKPDASFTDENAGLMGALAVLLALHHRRRTGKGQFIDLSMREALLPLLGEALVDYSLNGRVARRRGNRHPSMAPHNVYACQGHDCWIAIAVGSDAEWQALRGAMGDPEWARDAQFATAEGRKRSERELDVLIEQWTKEQDQRELMTRLQQAGVSAGGVLDARGVTTDPHLEARGFYQRGQHASAGEMLYHRLGWTSNRPMQRAPMPAPRFGEHNDYVLADLLGLTDVEIRQLRESGAVADAPAQSPSEATVR
jgi:benzylsuccinate CoA-transferase BbsF subunit